MEFRFLPDWFMMSFRVASSIIGVAIILVGFEVDGAPVAGGATSQLTITTRGGERFEQAEVTRKTEKTVSFSHRDGAATISWSELTPDLLEQLGYKGGGSKSLAGNGKDRDGVNISPGADVRNEGQSSGVDGPDLIASQSAVDEKADTGWMVKACYILGAGALVTVFCWIAGRQVKCPRCKRLTHASILHTSYTGRDLARDTMFRHDTVYEAGWFGPNLAKPQAVIVREEEVLVPVKTYSLVLQCNQCGHVWVGSKIERDYDNV